MAAPGPRFSRLAPDDRRAAILACAREVFARHPYAQVSSAQLAAAAGVTRGLLHHYFGGKRELYIAVISQLRDELAESIRTDRGQDQAATVAANAESWLTQIERERELTAAALSAAGFEGDEEIAALLDETREAIVDRILVNNTGTLEHPPAVRFLVRSWLGMAESATREWLARGRATREQVQSVITTSLLAVLRESLPPLLEAASPGGPPPARP